MKATENTLKKDLQAIIQSAVQRDIYEPCIVFWTHQPIRPTRTIPAQNEKNDLKSE